MSVEGGSVPNSGSEGTSALLGFDPDDLEDTTRDFASLTCLLARISAKDILRGMVIGPNATNANTVDFPYSKVPLTALIFRISLVLCHLYPASNNTPVHCWATYIRLPTNVKIYE